MARQLRTTLAVPADPATAYAMLTDPDYVRAVGEATGGSDVRVSVEPTDEGGHVVTSRRVLPADVPSFAKALVGSTLDLTEVRTWGPADADGRRTGTVEVRFEGTPVSIGGTLDLHADGTGTECLVEAAVKASVPFIGGKIEGFAADEVALFMAKEGEVAAARLGG